MPYSCSRARTVALVLVCSYRVVCAHLLLSVTEHYLFDLKSPEVRTADNKDEEEGCVSKGDAGMTCSEPFSL